MILSRFAPVVFFTVKFELYPSGTVSKNAFNLRLWTPSRCFVSAFSLSLFSLPASRCQKDVKNKKQTNNIHQSNNLLFPSSSQPLLMNPAFYSSLTQVLCSSVSTVPFLPRSLPLSPLSLYYSYSFSWSPSGFAASRHVLFRRHKQLTTIYVTTSYNNGKAYFQLIGVSTGFAWVKMQRKHLQ